MVYHYNVIPGPVGLGDTLYDYGAQGGAPNYLGNHTRMCANSVYYPNYEGPPVVPNTPRGSPLGDHAAGFEYFQMQFNCFDVLASKCVVKWNQVNKGLFDDDDSVVCPFIVGIKVADKVSELSSNNITYYNISNQDKIRYKKFLLNENRTGRQTVVAGFSARRRWYGAKAVENVVTKNATGWSRPKDQIWYIPFICTTSGSTGLPYHQVSISVTYYVRWSDPRSVQEWDKANPNAQITQAPDQMMTVPEEDIVHNDAGDIDPGLAESAVAEVEKIADGDPAVLEVEEK